MDRVPTTHMTTTTSKPTIHSITLPNGEIATRSSKRTYTHCVVVIHDNRYHNWEITCFKNDLSWAVKHNDAERIARFTKYIQEAEQKIAAGEVSYGVVGWSQSAKNAASVSNKWQKIWNTRILECTRG